MELSQENSAPRQETRSSVDVTGTVAVRTLLIGLIVMALVAPGAARAQDEQDASSTQLWTNYILSFPRSEKLYVEYDIETAHQVSGGDPWHYLYGTGMVEYYPSKIFDLTGELVTGYTNQSAQENSFEASLRLGVRLHFLSQIFQHSGFVEKLRPERLPASRLGIANLARFEQRNFWYSGDHTSSHDLRFRDRVELKYAINKRTLAVDGVVYLMADAEWFVNLTGDDAAERFATKSRVRAGLGYRLGYKWRFDVLAQRDDARDTLDDEFKVEAYMIDLRVKMFF